ncbi:MAG TPA: hypothetical protein VIH72_08730 [Candidatus Acidoferrales bacterium]|jgi:hypothetical protein
MATPSRFWFPCSKQFGIGVTAWTRDDAEKMAREILAKYYRGAEIVGIVENIDVRALDQKHVVPNMGPVTFVGVWYPFLNL